MARQCETMLVIEKTQTDLALLHLYTHQPLVNSVNLSQTNMKQLGRGGGITEFTSYHCTRKKLVVNKCLKFSISGI